jgi:hypothetical protein
LLLRLLLLLLPHTLQMVIWLMKQTQQLSPGL